MILMIGIVIIHKRTDNALITELSKAWLSYNCANWVTVEAAGPLAASNEIINTCDALGNSFVIPVKIKTVMKWRLSSENNTFLWFSFSFSFSLSFYIVFLNQGHRTRNFYTDLSAVGHSVIRGLVTSGQWFRRKFLCLISWIKSLE